MRWQRRAYVPDIGAYYIVVGQGTSFKDDKLSILLPLRHEYATSLKRDSRTEPNQQMTIATYPSVTILKAR
jgi:hypothetical protein